MINVSLDRVTEIAASKVQEHTSSTTGEKFYTRNLMFFDQDGKVQTISVFSSTGEGIKITELV